MTEQTTVRVRILVATDRKGYWIAYGFAGESDPEQIKQAMTLDDVEPGEVYHWIEADVPLPAEAGPAIEGVVHAATTPQRAVPASRHRIL
jgi:hypothetical protein